ncbi:reverse transcriptase [Anaerobacillus alkaliphilus]|uniref:Reverse transcriptase n=1 Tax=Anaerobacillus alkaliphilus TaxID=1548597 RepID=A0A4Q0VMP1_9BACI|nr:reverse transcriptase domain-containing protein [Anaerobacillus alkaliphilus]RXI96304.1 reverse transcriptase [Anaerobacillus alkaliphilus]
MKQSNRLKLHSLPSSSQLDPKRYRAKGYLHFDSKIKIEHVSNKIQDQEWVAKHAFLPFIHYKIKQSKYTVQPGVTSKVLRTSQNKNLLKYKKTKERLIYYSSHLDSYIYKYYGDMLNESYNRFATENGIDEIAIAYRNNKQGKNNIDAAKEVFKFVLENERALIISLDFTKFFDTLDHKVLKENIKKVLGLSTLPTDFYKVFKSITNFSYIDKLLIDTYLIDKYGKDQLIKLKQKGSLKKVMDASEFRQFKKNNIRIHKLGYGIPQGSGMSAVCSNVHLIEFDIRLRDWAQDYNALYRRYCDDLILVIPLEKNKTTCGNTLVSEVYDIIKDFNDLVIQEEKTELRIFENGIIKNIYNQPDKIDYLGFLMDGSTIKLREKSVFKYYSRAYRKAKISKEATKVRGIKTFRSKLYKLYTHLGYNYKGYGNFISYAQTAHEKMADLPIKVIIKNQTRRHWTKIQSKL